MRRMAAVLIVCGLTLACGSSSPTAPSTTTPAASTLFNLSGQVSSTAGGFVSGATVRIADGPNAGRSVTTDGNGAYSFGTLTLSGFTLTISAPNYATSAKGVTLTSTQVVNVALTPLFPSVLGAWSGTLSFAAQGSSGSCNQTWLITSQTGGTFSGTFQITGGTGCSQAGTISGAITSTNAITSLGVVSNTVSNGAVCTDSNSVTTGLLSGRTMNVQKSFTRNCTSPPPAVTFAESQTISMTKQ